jgi:hypothetical protein
LYSNDLKGDQYVFKEFGGKRKRHCSNVLFADHCLECLVGLYDSVPCSRWVRSRWVHRQVSQETVQQERVKALCRCLFFACCFLSGSPFLTDRDSKAPQWGFFFGVETPASPEPVAAPVEAPMPAEAAVESPAVDTQTFHQPAAPSHSFQAPSEGTGEIKE